MNLTDGNLFFNRNEVKYKYPYLSKNIDCDILIIGGGISGAITAYYYVLKGYNVVLIEKNLISYGSTSATTAILEYQIDVDLIDLKEEIGEKEAVKCYKLCHEAILKLKEINDFINKEETKFKQIDSIYYTNKKSDVKKLEKEYTNRGKYFDLKLTNDINSKYAFKLINGSAIINPVIFTTELINKLTNYDNLYVYENTKIVNLYKNKACTNNKFEINFKKCIIATGFEAMPCIKESDVQLYKTYTIVTSKIDKFSANFTARDTSNPYHYLRFTDDSRIIFGGEDILIEKYDKSNDTKIYNKLEKDLKKLYPDLDFKVEYKYNGTFANTVDTLPIIDKISTNIYCNLGYGANGVLYSVIGANLLLNNKLYKYFKIR